MTSQSSTPSSPMPEEQRVVLAQEYVERLRVFYIHAAVFGATMVLIFIVNLLTNLSAGIAGEWWAWWSMWVLLGWGIGIAIHGLVVRLSRPNFGTSAWEEKQMKKLLGEETPEGF